MVFQDVQVNEAVQRQVDDGFCTRGEPLYPVLGVVLARFARDLLQDGVQGRVARFCPVDDEQALDICVDAAHEGEFREYGAGDGAVQVPAGNLVKVTALLVEEHQDELFRQAERLGCHTFGGKSHRSRSPSTSHNFGPLVPVTKLV